MSVTLPAVSRELVYVPDITGFRDGEEADPTTLPVDVALMPIDEQPAEEDWVEAAWVATATTPTAKILIGPGGAIAPAVGRWSLWLRIRGSVEQPQRPVGQIRIV